MKKPIFQGLSTYAFLGVFMLSTYLLGKVVGSGRAEDALGSILFAIFGSGLLSFGWGITKGVEITVNDLGSSGIYPALSRYFAILFLVFFTFLFGVYVGGL